MRETRKQRHRRIVAKCNAYEAQLEPRAWERAAGLVTPETHTFVEIDALTADYLFEDRETHTIVRIT